MKEQFNRIYAWMEDNPVTTALVSGGAAAGLAIALTAALGIYSNATFVQKTACSREPAGKQCGELREEVARAEPLRNPCISYQRVTETRGKHCRKFFVRRASRGGGAGTQLHPNSSSGQGAPAGESTPSAELPSSATQVPKGSEHGGVAPGKSGTKKPTKASAPAVPEPELPPAPMPAPIEEEPVEPGNSSDTPAAENSSGVKACVDLAVSACVKAELP